MVLLRLSEKKVLNVDKIAQFSITMKPKPQVVVSFTIPGEHGTGMIETYEGNEATRLIKWVDSNQEDLR